MLTLQPQPERLFLCQSTPGHLPPPFGILHRPTLKTFYNDTISFAGLEKDGEQWCAQVWFCQVGQGYGGE
ncbi:hypothetical protein [Variovorax sp. J31P207]|uniref:hypothetical protein n=1 Tax=Variovorax sp. J31P207 TaxID=3053510 RepID=UPI002577F55E|nr:hypothetical protein [Variovorax sp. J31P207]MDM0068373.1 hypothetical protein [Variovorax sp. J31P207]